MTLGTMSRGSRGKDEKKDGRKRKRSKDRTSDEGRGSDCEMERAKEVEKTTPVKKRNKKGEPNNRKKEESQNSSQNSRSESEGSHFQLHAAEESGDFDLSMEEEDNAVRETVTTPVSDEIGEQESEPEKEVVLKTPEEERRKARMIQDLSEFFHDEEKLNRMWNLVKAIKTSDTIEKDKNQAPRFFTGQQTEKQVGKNTGNRFGIDISRLGRSSKSQETLYSVNPGLGKEGSNKGLQGRELGSEIIALTESSPENVSSNDEISPSTDGGSEEGRRRLPPPPPRRDEDEQPGPSGWTAPASERIRRTKQRAQEGIQQAIANRVQAAKPPGESNFDAKNKSREGTNNSRHIIASLQDKDSDLSLLLDSINSLSTEGEFDPLAVQLDHLTKEKIERGEYVDLRKLVPRDLIGDDADEDELHWVMQDGTPRLRKRGGSELLPITGYRRWMTAFSGYARLYTRVNPTRGPETHQYMLDIQDAAQTYTWDSVYAYDKIFRMYMEKKPYHDWGTPYTKYWNKVLKKKEKERDFQSPRGQNGSQRGKRKCCWRYNKHGHCDRRNCEFDHRCQVCGKFGHGKSTCYFNKEGHQEGRNERASKEKRKERSSEGDRS